MFDFRPVFLVVGILLTILGLAMLVPMALDLALGHPDWQVFFVSAAFTLFVGISLWLVNRGYNQTLRLQQAFLLTVFSWLFLVIFAAIPLRLSELGLDYTDAFFEAMSGLTTTGSTVIAGLDTAPPGLLLWRAQLQWLGGIGIIVMAIAILPMLQVGGMQLFHLESSDTSEKVLPRAASIALWISVLYVSLSFVCFASYWAAGMTPFEAVAHAMTTIATGGFSTYDRSFAAFGTPAVEWIAVAFMLIGSLPFVLFLQAVNGLPGLLLRDGQVRYFLGLAFLLVLIMAAYQIVGGYGAGWDAVRASAFNVVSIMTGTGYVTADYGLWGGFAVLFFFCIMFVGGCAGSTSCGIKIFRFQIMQETVFTRARRLVYPHGVFTPRYNGRPVPEEVVSSVLTFFFLFFATFTIVAVCLSLMGLDPLTALSAAGTALANVGPGLGPVVGPAGNFAPLPDAAKWLLSLAMLLGRLELLTVLVLLSPAFWRG